MSLPPDDSEHAVKASCIAVFDDDGFAAAERALEAVRLDTKWTLFYVALTDRLDGRLEWMPKGVDEAVIEATCSSTKARDDEVRLLQPLDTFVVPAVSNK